MLFNRCGIETQMVKRIIGRLWCKVITYSAINPVSAILQVPNGSLTSKMESITLMKRLLDEGRAVANACSIELVYPDLYELLFDACETSANNLSSMLQDILERGAHRDRGPEWGDLPFCRGARNQRAHSPNHGGTDQAAGMLETRS